MRELVFKAQSLDNRSPDHYQIGDELISIEAESRRREITNQISEVALKGKFLFKSKGAEFIIHHSRFLVQVYSLQLDRAGRRAPILCSGELNRDDNLQFESRNIINAITKFAARIDRSIEPEHAEVIADVIANLKKKGGHHIWVGICFTVALIILVAISFHLSMTKR